MSLYLRTGGFGRSFKDMVGNFAGLAGARDPFRVRLPHKALPYPLPRGVTGGVEQRGLVVSVIGSLERPTTVW